MSDEQEPVALIAGYGRPPFLAAKGIKQAGKKLIVVALSGLASSRLKGLADEFIPCSIARPGSWVKAMRRNGVHEAIMLGGVRKREIYSPFRILRYIPDLKAIRVWYFRVRKDKRDNAVLLAVADELRNEGIELVSSMKYCQEHLAHEGLMTKTPIPGNVLEDVDFGWRIARASAELDIGQAIAVKERDIIAVEAMEGTDAMIRRAGRLCRVGGWTLIKVARPKQDMRFDVPTVGPGTLKNLKDANCVCLVVEADKTLIVDKPTTLELADKMKIAIIGKKAE